MLKNLTPWILFLVSVLLLSMGGSPIGPSADRLLVALRFSILILLSILVVRQKFRPKPRYQNSRNLDRGDALLSALTRWFRGESNLNQ